MTFTVIVTLLTHAKTGIRGRRAARYFLAAYLLITLAYPGVKLARCDLVASRIIDCIFELAVGLPIFNQSERWPNNVHLFGLELISWFVGANGSFRSSV